MSGELTVYFSGPLTPQDHSIPWANPPFVEDSMPAVLYAPAPGGQSTSQVLTFNEPLQTFGLEMQPNQNITFFPSVLTAQFFDGSTLLGTITKTNLSQHGGARLFAATDTDAPITSVVLTANRLSLGFFIADVRAQVVPEPASLGLFGMGVVVAIGYGWRRRRFATYTGVARQ
jgi:hypothetical protein